MRTVGANRIGQQTRIPRGRPPKRRTPKYRNSAVLGGLSGMFGALFLATGQILWAVGAVTQAVGAAVAAYVDYHRDLIEVKRTGQPVGAPKAGDPVPAGVTPVDLDTPRRAARPKSSTDAHLARCKAKPPGGPTCRCPDGPNRKGKPAAKKTGATGRKR